MSSYDKDLLICISQIKIDKKKKNMGYSVKFALHK